MRIKRALLCALTGFTVLILGAATRAPAQTNYIVNGNFEAGFYTFNNTHPLDGSKPDTIPNGWLDWESFTGGGIEAAKVDRLADNGPSRPGSNAVFYRRSNGGGSGDETGLRQDLAIDARSCSALTLNMDVLVNSHNLEGGGWVTPAFEWPAYVWVNYTTLTGATQIWRFGWYLDPPGDGRANDPGSGLIPEYRDKKITQGSWDANSFDLFAELPQVKTIDRIIIGGAGWDYEGAVDNVEILCTANLRLNDRRFQIEARWRTQSGQTGTGTGVQLTNDSGYFWFFNPNNIEVVVKVLDACVPPFNHYWVFSAGLTNVEVKLLVRDLAAGVEHEYVNPLGRAYPPTFDTSTFSTCAVPDPLPICFDMEGVATGVAFGAPLGQTPGQVVLDEDGVKVTVETFYFTNGGSTFNQASIDPPGTVPGLPHGQTLGINNLNFKVDYSALPWRPSQVAFDFTDMGGFENLALNGQPFPPYAGELTAAPCPIAGVACSFTPNRATFTGAISSVQFGGQELWIDNLCAYP